MLNEIKALVKERQEQLAMQESANVLESEINSLGSSNKDFLESVLLLTEDTDENENKEEEEAKESELDNFEEDPESINNEEVPDTDKIKIPENEPVSEPEDSSIGEVPPAEDNNPSEQEPEDEPISDEPILPKEPAEDLGNNEPVTPENNDLDNEPIPDDGLPDPISSGTGEPVQNADNVILSTEIDISTGTPRDTLPIPPVGAGDAVASDDQMTQRIDSGFDDEIVPEDDNDEHNPEADDIDGSPVVDYGANGNDSDDDLELESFLDVTPDDLFMEEITIGNSPNDNKDQDGEQPADANVTPEDTTGTGGKKEDQPEEDSPVTKEVLDQVNDNDTGGKLPPVQEDDSLDNLEVPGDNPTEDPTASGNEDTVNAPTNENNVEKVQKIFDKLSSISKGVEDARSAVLTILNNKK